MKIKILIALVLLGVMLGAYIQTSRESQTDAVSAKELARMVKNKNFTMINVHTPYEGEIMSTDMFIPYNEIVANSTNLPKDKNAPIILYCQSGTMSAQALSTVRKLGYTNVRHLAGGMEAWTTNGGKLLDLSKLEEEVTPVAGVELPISWGELPMKLVAAGVIDQTKFMDTVQPAGADKDIFMKQSKDRIRITKENSQFVVDMLWAIGLAQKSIVYTEGPMGKEYKDKVGNFSSTGGWTLARGSATDYLNRFDFIPLTDVEQQRVASIAKNVYRPCCGNSTWFPDCNHGMAALAAIEMMVAAGIDDKTIYKNVLALNSYWFSQTYLTTATYFARQGTSWDKVDAKDILGEKYSSGQGATEIANKVGPLPYHPASAGGSCGA